MSALSLKSLKVSYGDSVVIDDVSLDVKAGEIFGLIGLNGAGKTTIIKSVLGLRDPNEGDISILGKDRGDKNVKSLVSYLPEKFEPPWFLTGMEFVKFALSLYGVSLDDDTILRAAQGLALDVDALSRRMHTYSKGMKQKLGILGTLLTEGRFFILDEPMSGLDPRARHLVKNMICDMKSQDRTIFLSSHVLSDMDEICDRVAVLHDGRIRFVGEPQKLKDEMNVDNLERAFLQYIEG